MTRFPCLTCDASGTVHGYRWAADPRAFGECRCPVCDGTGEVEHEDEPAPDPFDDREVA